jgi:RNA polymerase sigma factor (sigma-70 family)
VSSTTNTQLLVGLRDPQNDAIWSEFVRRYQPVLLAFARRLGLNEPDAQDAAQDALMAFAAGYREGKYDPGRGRLRTWLYGIAANKIHDVQRQRPRDRLIADASNETAFLERVPDDHSMSEIWEAEWRRSVLASCMEEVRREIKPSSMQVFELCVLQKRPVDETADRLGMSRDAVLKARTRVLSRIREIRARMESEW